MKYFYLVPLLIVAHNLAGQQKIKDHYSAADLFNTEAAFSKMATVSGFKAANFMYAADSALVFRPGEINALKWAAVQPDSVFGIKWYASFVDISGAGDLGYAIGPFENHYDRSDTTKYILGQFATVWQKQEDGSLKFIMDFGTSQLPRSFSLQRETEFKPASAKVASRAKPANRPGVLHKILALEKLFNETCKKEGDIAAYRKFSANNIRFIYQREFYVLGIDAALSILQTRTGNHEWLIRKINVSDDMVHLYGTHKYYSINKIQEGYFMRIWKKQTDGQWKIVVQVRNLPS